MGKIRRKLYSYFYHNRIRLIFDWDSWKDKANQVIGEEIAKNTVALNMLNANESIKRITAFTGLNEKTIIKVKKLRELED